MLQSEMTLERALAEEVRKRFERRGVFKEFSESELRKIASAAQGIGRHGHPLGVMRAFLDYSMPTGGTFTPVKNVYFEWRSFEVEHLPSIEHLFPLSKDVELGLERILVDWRLLGKDLMYYRSVYDSPGRVGSMKIARFYRDTPDFYRMLGVFRLYQNNSEMVGHYPLFTMRSFLAAQIERLVGYLDRLVVGNVVSLKARERFEDWYCLKFYPKELVAKAKKRPSENNPVCNPKIRREYELNRVRRGIRAGDFTFDGEDSIPEITRPALYDEDAGEVFVAASSGVTLPSTMGDLLE